MTEPTEKQIEYAQYLVERLGLDRGNSGHPYRLIAWNRGCSLNQAWQHYNKFELSRAISAARVELKKEKSRG